jgi:hypothetical protein
MMMAQEQLQSRHGLPNSSNALPFGGADTGLSQNRALQNRYSLLHLMLQTRSIHNNFLTSSW